MKEEHEENVAFLADLYHSIQKESHRYNHIFSAIRREYYSEVSILAGGKEAKIESVIAAAYNRAIDGGAEVDYGLEMIKLTHLVQDILRIKGCDYLFMPPDAIEALDEEDLLMIYATIYGFNQEKTRFRRKLGPAAVKRIEARILDLPGLNRLSLKYGSALIPTLERALEILAENHSFLMALFIEFNMRSEGWHLVTSAEVDEEDIDWKNSLSKLTEKEKLAAINAQKYFIDYILLVSKGYFKGHADRLFMVCDGHDGTHHDDLLAGRYKYVDANRPIDTEMYNLLHTVLGCSMNIQSLFIKYLKSPSLTRDIIFGVYRGPRDTESSSIEEKEIEDGYTEADEPVAEYGYDAMFFDVIIYVLRIVGLIAVMIVDTIGGHEDSSEEE